MGITTTLVGASWGVGTVMYCNALRKVAYFKRPWEHLVVGIACAYGAHKLVQAENFLRDRVMYEVELNMEKNKDKYEGQFRDILGDKFDDFFASK
mmetsp:Transcript_8190/g.19223  ORF Transcript_8190/g.19223 Transcript_8190/m.19223 type:complete len:95 (+) Transcript_8190:108-392(+)|eukprot:CAMPEP_0119368862 /NCGR_PEP_ID=MMETSP1334-20130426/15462_1 /TAXON_ID=127549 /ORGANISM="Calcidiscus leptoporus, Strain RCC1130" /LENGTH=94 /DNA_ID=CAMNT_0007385593 /DNA_START=89 /DNA_END=373 /DNA_ORIENTATION=+